ncbi:Hypothetical predicted protein [Paramuricea clavata]|nr:Hypothetical predicted protein [Paramuricea clavata]
MKQLPTTILQMRLSHDKPEQFDKEYGYLGPAIYTKVSQLRQTIMTAAAKSGQRPSSGSKQVILKLMIPNSTSSGSAPTTPTTPSTPLTPSSSVISISRSLPSPAVVSVKPPLKSPSAVSISSNPATLTTSTSSLNKAL